MFGTAKHLDGMDVEAFAASRGRDWTYIIFGSGGPTGKTYLYNKLRWKGYNAIELTEEICSFVEYRDRKNHYLIYEDSKVVVIILNKLIPQRKNERPDTLVENIAFETKYDACKALEQIHQLAHWYGLVTIADLMDIANLPHRGRANKFGWFEYMVDKATIEPTRLGWVINLPKALHIM
jgi:hypothetical protein